VKNSVNVDQTDPTAPEQGEPRRHQRVQSVLTVLALLGCAIVPSAMAGNAPSQPPCTLQPECDAMLPSAPIDEQNLHEESAMEASLETFALQAALQTPSAFGLLQALHEPDPTEAPRRQKWCKNTNP
jgi:hypothetical protein